MPQDTHLGGGPCIRTPEDSLMIRMEIMLRHLQDRLSLRLAPDAVVARLT